MYRDSKLYIGLSQKHEYDLLIVDDLNIQSKSYVRRLEQLKETHESAISYDYTCGNLTSLLLSKSKWGYDSNLKIHEFKNKNESFKHTCRPIIKIVKNSFWVPEISYPFDLPYFLIDIENLKNLWVNLVYIDMAWHVYKFSGAYIDKKTIML